MKRWSISKITITMAVVILGVVSGSLVFAYQEKNAGIKFTEKMSSGWNLGNSLDVYGDDIEGGISSYETYWGNPVTTKEMIDEIKNAGFGTVRIPVTWYQHMDESGIIEQAWLERVKEIIDYVLENEMYAMINLHHDDWYVPSVKNAENAKTKLKSTWTQIAEYFGEYDEHLIFEGMNEARLMNTEYEWNAEHPQSLKIVNEYNQVFVDAVRSSGKENAKRYLMVAPYCNLPDKKALDAFVLPKDKRLIVSIHKYVPYEFAMKEQEDASWSSEKKEDTKEIDTMMDRLHKRFIKKGIPVIISEFGAIDKNNRESRIEYTRYYMKAASARKIMCIWWDDGGDEGTEGKYKIFNRESLTWEFPEIKEILVQHSLNN